MATALTGYASVLKQCEVIEAFPSIPDGKSTETATRAQELAAVAEKNDSVWWSPAGAFALLTALHARWSGQIRAPVNDLVAKIRKSFRQKTIPPDSLKC